MKEYTKEDYKALYEMSIDKTMDFPFFLNCYIRDDWRFLSEGYRKFYNPKNKLDSFKKCCQKYYAKCYEMLYEIPFEDLPLHINLGDKHLLTVVKWRLGIGK